MIPSRPIGYALIGASALMATLAIVNPALIDEFNVYWMAVSMAFIPGLLFILKRDAAAIYFSRIVLGSVFLVSGLIKANDTIGFGIKLEEYFDENALGAFWAIFHDWSLILAILISGVEVLLGLAVLFGLQVRLVAVVLLLMTVFFGWLTYFTANCNEMQMQAMAEGLPFDGVCVTDCGCFGDAMRGSVGRSLTPWESFYKDLGLFFLTLVVLLRSKFINVNTNREDVIILPGAVLVIAIFGGWLFGWIFPLVFFLITALIYFVLRTQRPSKPSTTWLIIGVLTVVTYAFSIYTYYHLPIKDFRPYAVGKNIKDQMKSAKELGLQPTEYATVYKLTHAGTNEERTVNSKVYLEQELWKDTLWQITFSSPDPIVLQRGYEPPIAAFNVMNADGSDIGDELLNDPNFSIMIVMHDVNKAEAGEVADRIRELSAEAQANNFNVYAVTSSPYDVHETYRHANQWAVPFYTGDEIFLKTIVRSNPGVLLLKNGLIVAKWSAGDVPTFAEMQANYLK